MRASSLVISVWLFVSALACGSGGASTAPQQVSADESSAPDSTASRSDASLEHGFALELVATGFQQAVAFAFAGDDRIFVAEKSGVVRTIAGGRLREAPFVDLSVEVNAANDRGLLGLAAHPRFPAEPYLYLLYTYDPPELTSLSALAAPDGHGARGSRLVRLTADAATDYTTALAGSKVVLLGEHSTIDNVGRVDARNDYERPGCGVRGAYVDDCLPGDENSHGIGTVLFGPDGALYVGNGDGCDYTAAQPVCTRALDVDSLAGKILRIDPVTGAGLPDNPFVDGGDLRRNRAKVYQLGLRNPFRFAFDRATSALYVGDVGWNLWEEINRAGPGANFGWPCYEGGNGLSVAQPSYRDLPRCLELESALTPTPVTPALYAYAHEGLLPGQGSAILVGDVYRGSAYPPLYRGALFYSDINRRELRFLAFDEAGNVESSQLFQRAIGFHTQITAHPRQDDLYILQIGAGPDAPESKLERLVFRGYGPGPRPGGLYELRASESQDCVEVVDTAEEKSLAARACRKDASQRWLLEQVGDALYRFASEHTAEVLMLTSEVPSARAQLRAWQDAPGQRFRIFPLGDGFQIISEDSGVCLGARRSESDVQLISARCASDASQIFQIASEQNRPPVLPQVPMQTGTVGSTVQLAITASDGEQEELTYFARGLPVGTSIDPHSGVVMGALSVPGTYAVAARVSDGELEASQTFYWIVQPDRLPDVTIALPPEGTTYVAGETIALVGAAHTHDGVPLDPERLSWELFSHHNQHVHFGGLPTTRGATGAFVADDHGDNTTLELCLTATDLENRVGRSCRILRPRTVALTIDSAPSGLRIPWEGVARETPFTVDTNLGGKRILSAPTLQFGLTFQGWSDGGPASRILSIDGRVDRLVATYR